MSNNLKARINHLKELDILIEELQKKKSEITGIVVSFETEPDPEAEIVESVTYSRYHGGINRCRGLACFMVDDLNSDRQELRKQQ
jgi:hypothetical protein